MTQQLFKRYENVFNAKLITLRNWKCNTNVGSQACPLMWESNTNYAYEHKCFPVSFSLEKWMFAVALCIYICEKWKFIAPTMAANDLYPYLYPYPTICPSKPMSSPVSLPWNWKAIRYICILYLEVLQLLLLPFFITVIIYLRQFFNHTIAACGQAA